MIQVIRKDSRRGFCNVCMSTTNIELYFRSNYNNQGIIVTVCEDCARELAKRIVEEVGQSD